MITFIKNQRHFHRNGRSIVNCLCGQRDSWRWFHHVWSHYFPWLPHHAHCLHFVHDGLCAVLYWGAYDYRADGFIGVEYIFYLLAFGITALGLLTTYTQIYVDHCHYFKVSSRETVSKEQIAQNEIQSKWWTMFQVNGLYLLLFLFANFYAFKCSIPSLHFRYLLTTAGPAASLHLWIHGTHSILGGKDTPQKWRNDLTEKEVFQNDSIHLISTEHSVSLFWRQFMEKASSWTMNPRAIPLNPENVQKLLALQLLSV